MAYSGQEEKDKIVFVTKEEHKSPSNAELVVDDPSDPHAEYGLTLQSGSINWNCPCLGGMASGPCAGHFKSAFSCFHDSSEKIKGSDCVGQYQAMQECMQRYPDVYPKEENKDEDEDEDDFYQEGLGNDEDEEEKDEEEVDDDDDDDYYEGFENEEVEEVDEDEEEEEDGDYYYYEEEEDDEEEEDYYEDYYENNYYDHDDYYYDNDDYYEGQLL